MYYLNGGHDCDPVVVTNISISKKTFTALASDLSLNWMNWECREVLAKVNQDKRERRNVRESGKISWMYIRVQKVLGMQKTGIIYTSER